MSAGSSRAEPEESGAEGSGGRTRRYAHWSRLLNRPTQFLLDLGVLSAAFVVAYLVRFEFGPSRAVLETMLVQMPYVVLTQFAFLHLVGAYAFVWRYFGMSELKPFVKAAIYSTIPLVVARLALPDTFQSWRVPFSVIVMDVVLAFGGLLAMRVLRRALFEKYERDSRKGDGGPDAKRPVLLVGAGRAGVLAAREIQGRGDLDLEIRGFVDDDLSKVGLTVQGVRILGTTADLERLVSELRIDHVIITVAKASRKDIRRIVEVCEKIPVKAKIIPGLFEILGGRVEVSRIRDVQIEDLLGRDPVQLDDGLIQSFVTNKTVMVTGAGGSIGSELVRQVAQFGPSCLLLVERAEFVLFEIDREVEEHWPGLAVVPLVADVGDEPRMREIMTMFRPRVVMHAAAHKHVPLMEQNPCEAVKNNVFGTRTLAELAGETGAEAFVQISTDKAVRPTSVMGATKRLAELVVQDLDRRYPTRYVSVRFGNVLGSAGSVVPIFRRQILNGGPITITHPEMVRYFMTIPEAAQLVLQAGAMGEGGEIFVLDMGEPVRIVDLARDMVVLSGLRPHEDIDIVFTGVRPGEKMFEELQTDGEEIAKTRHPKVFIGRINGAADGEIMAALRELQSISARGDEEGVRRFFNRFLPEARVQVSPDHPLVPAVGDV